MRRVKINDVDEYVKKNNAELTQSVIKLQEEQQEAIHNYRVKNEVPQQVRNHLYSDLNINMISVEKYGTDKSDMTWIFLNNKPKDMGYDLCGIYYVDDNFIVDYYGNKQDGDAYEYDGTPEGVRIKYKSYKICDKWYYFEQSVWN